MCFTTTGLTICHNRSIKAFQYLFYNRTYSCIIYILLSAIWIKSLIIDPIDRLLVSSLWIGSHYRTCSFIFERDTKRVISGGKLTLVKRSKSAVNLNVSRGFIWQLSGCFQRWWRWLHRQRWTFSHLCHSSLRSCIRSALNQRIISVHRFFLNQRGWRTICVCLNLSSSFES